MPRCLLALLVLTLAACSTETMPIPAPVLYQPVESAVYPVLLLTRTLYDPLLCVCKTPAELRRRADKELEYLQKSGELIDAAGTHFYLQQIRPANGPRSGLRKLLVATILPNQSLEISFSLEPALTSRGTETWDALARYHDHFRACGVTKGLPPLQLIRGLQNRNCVYPPL